MTNLYDTAKNYESKITKNIADLDRVPLKELEVENGKGKDDEGVEFEYKFISLNAEEYRVPKSVLEKIKTMIELKPELIAVKVHKTGSGMATRYEVKPLN